MSEVRETLCDLRTDVHRRRDSVGTITAFLERVAARGRARRQRSSTSAHAACPCVQEREMWRIAQEAITNVERHAARHGT